MSTAPPLYIPGARFSSASVSPPPMSPTETGQSSRNPFRRHASDSSQGSVRHSSYGSAGGVNPLIRTLSDQRSSSPFEQHPQVLAPARDQQSPFGGSDPILGSEPDIWETRVDSPSFENRPYTPTARNNPNRMSLNPFLSDLPSSANNKTYSSLPQTTEVTSNSNATGYPEWSQPSSAPQQRARFPTESTSLPPTRRRSSAQRPMTYYATREDPKFEEDFIMSNRTTNRPRSSSDLNNKDLPSYDDVLQDAPPRTFGNEYGHGDEKESDSSRQAPPASRSSRREVRSSQSRSHSSQPRSQSHSQSRDERRASRKPETPEERRARKEREYEKFKRYQERKDREAAIAAGQRPTRSSKTGQPLDTIDKLDVTGFGFGSGFHHDGPFDACRPHRNKQTNFKAPVAAFPANGANNALGPAKHSDEPIDAWGRTETEAFSDFSAPRMASSGRQIQRCEEHNRFDPTNKADLVHGTSTQGLGTSTFLEGAPASQADIEASYHQEKLSGLGRKKSLVQRIRKGATGSDSSPPPRPNDASKGVYRTSSNDSHKDKEYYGDKPVESEGGGLLRRVKSLKVTRRRS